MKRIFLLSVLTLVSLGLQANERKDSTFHAPHISLLVNAQLGSYYANFEGQFVGELKLDATPILSASLEYSGKNNTFWKVQYTLNRYYKFWQHGNYLTRFDERMNKKNAHGFQSQLSILRGKTIFAENKFLNMKLYGGAGLFFIPNSELPDYFEYFHPEKIGDVVEINEKTGVLSQDGQIRKVTPYVSFQIVKEFELVDGVNFFAGYQVNYTPINMAEKSYWLQVGDQKEYWSQEQYSLNQWGLMFGIRGHLFHLSKPD